MQQVYKPASTRLAERRASCYGEQDGKRGEAGRVASAERIDLAIPAPVERGEQRTHPGNGVAEQLEERLGIAAGGLETERDGAGRRSEIHACHRASRAADP